MVTQLRCSLGIALMASFMVIAPPAMAQFFQQGGKLVGTGAIGNAQQGAAVSLSADGNTAIVGGPQDNSWGGAAWVYTRSSSSWSQHGSKLAGGVGEMFGWSVAISADGNTAIVGLEYDTSGIGAVQVFIRADTGWTRQGSKLVGTGAVGFARQGYSVALSADGNTAIVGGAFDDSYTGAAWVFTRSDTLWTQQGNKLVGTGAVGASVQGGSVSLSADGNTAIVGGPGDNAGMGATWVFTRSSGVWTQQGNKLVGTGGLSQSGQGQSVSVAADGSTVLVGGPTDNAQTGGAWVFTRSAGIWTQQGNKLVGKGATSSNVYQGYSVSLSADGNVAILGGLGDNSNVGAVWTFTRSAGVWTQQGDKLSGTGAVGSARQGTSVSISADGYTAIVGGNYDNTSVGAVWCFRAHVPMPIGSIDDLPGDQGGQVRVRWHRSTLDESNIGRVTSYGIWRKFPWLSSKTINKLEPPGGYAVLSESLKNYDYVMTVNAAQIDSYSVVVPTLGDSSASGIPYSTFVISTHTTNPVIYYLSEPDSGYSVDNLSPVPPAGLVAYVTAGPHVELQWDPPTDLDVGHYDIHRAGTGGFTPGAGNKIGTSPSTIFTDSSPIQGSPGYYKIIAVDLHNNASAPSNEVEVGAMVSRQFDVTEKWNLVSVPLTMGDYTKTVLFPDAFTNAFTFEEGYVAYGILQNGKGYWMKFTTGGTISHEGSERTEDTIAVAEGWNLVGSLSSPISTGNVGSIPGGLVTSGFYRYDNGYSSSPTLDPGRGYWVKVLLAGQLVMSATSASPANRIRIEDTGDIPPPPPGQVSAEPPLTYALEQNHPNPFNPVTSISYALPAPEHVRLIVYNMVGQEVAVLVDESQEAGFKTISFDARNLPSGVYTYRITAGAFAEVKRMVMLK